MTPQELKNSILQLAIQGKLVEQRAEEGTAAELVEKILAAKNAKGAKGNLTRSRGARGEKATSALSASPREAIPDDEKPFDIPESWEWVRLGEVSCLISDGTHKTPSYVEEGVPFLSVKDISSGALDFSNTRYISYEEHLSLSVRGRPEKGDILVCRIGTLGKAVKINIDKEFSIFVSLGLIKLINKALADYIVLTINSGYGFSWIQRVKVGGGTHTFKINLEDLRQMPIPLPPLAEQKRIVAKIEELLPLIDRYEKAWSKLEDFNKRFPVDMQKSLLQMAIQGKLVEQRPEEGTGEELYRQIQSEKQRLIKSGKIKKEKPLPEITPDEIPFDIPESWKWVRHNALFEIVGGSQPPKSKFRDTPQEGYVRLYQIRDYGERPVPVYVPTKMVSKFTQKGDILLARYGGSLGKIFWAENGAYNVAMAKVVRLYEGNMVDNKYLYYYYLAPLYQTLIKGNTRSAQAGFNKEDLNYLLFPLPPLAEQKRIVAKLEELLPLCERLK